MSEFDKSWFGWDLKRPNDQLIDCMTDPLGGLALVETGVDVSGLLEKVAVSADELFSAQKSEVSRYLFCSSSGRISTQGNDGELLFPVLEENIDVIDGVLAATREITQPLIGYFSANLQRLRAIPQSGMSIGVSRRVGLRPSHYDFGILTMWLGSTHPGLNVMHRGEWQAVDDVPAGHGFIWRDDLIYDDNGNNLPAIRHYAKYRSVHRRATMLAD